MSTATFSTVDLALKFKVAPEEIAEMADRGEIRSTKTADGRRLYTDADVRAYIQQSAYVAGSAV